jgi:hypothetical protein
MSLVAKAVNMVHRIAYGSPLETWNTAALVRSKYTPDASHLYTKRCWWHFNYDERSSVEQRYIGFTNDEFCVWRKELEDNSVYGHVALEAKSTDISSRSNLYSWSDPSLSKGSYTFAPSARVRGCLELLPTSDYFQLDTDLKNGVVFDRKRVRVLVPLQTIITKTTKKGKVYYEREMFVKSVMAWMYVGNEKYFSEGQPNEKGELVGAIDAGYSYDIANISRPASFWIGDFYYAE